MKLTELNYYYDIKEISNVAEKSLFQLQNVGKIFKKYS